MKTVTGASAVRPLFNKEAMHQIERFPRTRPSPGVPLDQEYLNLVAFVQSDPALCRQWLKNMIGRGWHFKVDVDEMTLGECHEAVWDIAEAVWLNHHREKMH